ncbi:hypothetical protein WB334_26415, partial [Escherichia coli]|nr:hypothetical protein [Escherichia coli]
EPHIGPPNAFSFNTPSSTTSGTRVDSLGATTVLEGETYLGGMCPECEGMGSVNDIDLAELFDDSKSLADGALTIPGYNATGWAVRMFTESGFLPADVPIRDFTDEQRHDFLYKEATKVKIAGMNMTYTGLIPSVQ